MDSELEKLIRKEEERQENKIELIASENFTSNGVREAQGSVLTNKYAEGYPGKRYYGGCEFVDKIENLAIDRACELFNCNYANVQPHCGSSANMQVYFALLNLGDKILGMDLNHGGHLTHGKNINFSGKQYNFISYGVDPITERIDYNKLIEIAKLEKPKLIIAGASAYSRIIDFEKFREAADSCGAVLMVDMAHIAGLVATGLHPSPIPYADVVTTTTHKTLRGPRGGMILTNSDDIIKKINKAVFPGTQGGPLMHVIAGKAQAFGEALKPEFKTYQEQVIKNIAQMAYMFEQNGYRMLSGGTDNHMLLLDINSTLGITGKAAEEVLASIGIIVNKNLIPYDTLSPDLTSGIRIGSPAMTTKGFTEEEFAETTKIIVEALNNYKNNLEYMYLKEKVDTLVLGK